MKISFSWNDVYIRIKSKFTWKSCYSEQLNDTNKDFIVGKNVYNNGRKMKDYVKEQNVIHKLFKYKLVYPLLLLGNKILGKYLVKFVPNNVQFKELKVFDDAFNKSVEEWYSFYLYNTRGRSNHYTRDEFMSKFYKKDDLYKLLMTFKEFYLTICKNDTAYLELHNILMFNIAMSMNYSHDSEVAHLLYTSDSINDVRYFILKDKLRIQEVNHGK